jgi:hypothetical protein
MKQLVVFSTLLLLVVLPWLPAQGAEKEEKTILAQSSNWRVQLDKVEYVTVETRTGMFDRPYYLISKRGPKPTEYVGITVTATATAKNKEHTSYAEGREGDVKLKIRAFGENTQTKEFVADSLEGVVGVSPFEVPKGEMRKEVIVLMLTKEQAKQWPGKKHVIKISKFYDVPEFKVEFELPN